MYWVLYMSVRCYLCQILIIGCQDVTNNCSTQGSWQSRVSVYSLLYHVDQYGWYLRALLWVLFLWFEKLLICKKSSRVLYIFSKAIFCRKKEKIILKMVGKNTSLTNIFFERRLQEKNGRKLTPIIFNLRGGLLFFPKKSYL